MRQLLRAFGLSGEKMDEEELPYFEAYLRDYNFGDGETLRDVFNNYRSKNPAKVRQLVAQGKIPYSSLGFYDSKVQKRVQISTGEVAKILAAAESDPGRGIKPTPAQLHNAKMLGVELGIPHDAFFVAFKRWMEEQPQRLDAMRLASKDGNEFKDGTPITDPKVLEALRKYAAEEIMAKIAKAKELQGQLILDIANAKGSQGSQAKVKARTAANDAYKEQVRLFDEMMASDMARHPEVFD